MKINYGLILFLLSISSYAQDIKIPIGDSWKYYDQGNVGTTSWKDSNFNDAPWASGNAELGYGEGDENTVINYGSSSNNKHITSYFRNNFSLTETGDLDCQIKVDDGTVVYLNGVEVFRENLPTGTISFSTTALDGSNENTWHSFTIPSNLTTVGNNTIAVEMHQQSAGSSDLSFDFELVTIPPPPNPGLYINEIMASNSNTVDDQAGELNDWVEIYNAYNYSINLNGYYLSDDPEELDKHEITSSIIIPAGGRKIFWASGNTSTGNNHLNFSLSANGEFIAISDPNENIIDSFNFTEQRTDVSYGRLTDGSPSMRFFANPTFDSENIAANSYLGILQPPTFSEEGGFKNSSFNLSLSSNIEGTNIYYTTDGSIPSHQNTSGTSYNYKNNYPGPLLSDSFISNQYNSSISIFDKSNSANKIASKSSSFKSPDYIPTSPIRKGTIISAIASKAGYISSKPSTQTYFFFPSSDFSFPILSVSTNENNLFDYYNGTYTAGIDYDNFSLGDVGVCTQGNYFRSGSLYEREATFEYFDNGEKLMGFPVQMRLHGGCSRSIPRKSLRLYADDVFDYPIFDKFPERRHKRIIVRNSGNDAFGTLFRDALYQDIVGGLNFASQETTPSILFLNGEYWGIHNIRERFDKYFFQELYGLDTEKLDLLSPTFNPEVEEGDLVSYNDLKNFLSNNGMSSTSNYNQLKSLIDVDNFIDYQIAGMYCANFDWITNNVRMWRTRTIQPQASQGDKRWRWILFDVDHGLNGFYGADYNTFDLSTQEMPETMTFRRLLENSEFRQKFINRFCDLLNTTFLSTHCNTKTEQWRLKYLPYMDEHIDRWEAPSSKSAWENEIQEVKDFFTQRPNIQRSQIKNFFGSLNEKELTVDVNSDLQGFIKVNTISIHENTEGVDSNPYPWTGVYFDNIPIELTAVPQIGYKFIRWEKNGSTYSSNVMITISLTSNVTYKAIFEEDFISSNPTPIALALDKCGYQFITWDYQSATGSFPGNMAFVYMDQNDPSISAEIEGFTSGDYDENSKTRINGLGEEGISFINTGNIEGNPGYPGTKLGGAILALNTTDYDSLSISFTAGTIAANNREYNLRLQYRIGDLLPFQDVLDENDAPIEYVRNAANNHEELFENIMLPSEIMNKPYVQLLWRYYFTGTRNSTSGGARDEIRLDNIMISPQKHFVGNFTGASYINEYEKVSTQQIISPSSELTYEASKSILLLPGFKAPNASIFNAEINNCK